MRRGVIPAVIAAGVLAVHLATGVALAQEPHGAEEPPESLESWRRLGTSAWRFDSTGVEAGPEDAMAYLVSNEAYGDFRIELEYWIADDTNSGVFVRCGVVRAISEVNPDNCYEINIWDNHPNQEFRTGSIVQHAPPVSHADSLGHWNKLEILARGSTISVRVNGDLTAEFGGAAADTGLVALQYAGKGLLRIRGFEIHSD